MREPALTHPSAAVFLGDCIDVLAEIPDNSIDAIVTDPPYGLGFMGKAWDDLPPGLPWAQECLRVLKPGGHLLAFGGTRTWHRLAVAVEDAGFEVRDSIAWLYGSGFPKSLDVSKAIDKHRDDRDAIVAVTSFMADHAERHGLTRADVDAHMGTSDMSGWWLTRLRHRCLVPKVEQYARLKALLSLPDDMDAEVWRLNGRKGAPGEAWERREVIGEVTHARSGGADFAKIPGSTPTPRVEAVTVPATPAAQQWQGWGTALKPAFEPIVVARKPLVGTVAANVLAYGTGALNIDATRVDGDGAKKWETPRGGIWTTDSAATAQLVDSGKGRFPANVLLDGDAAAELDEQSGSLSVNGPAVYRRSKADAVSNPSSWEKNHQQGATRLGYGDTGGASRFFPVFRYQAKAPTRERPTVVAEDGTKTAHPTVKPLALMRWLVRLVTPPGGTVLDTFAGSGATIEAAVEEGFYAMGIEREETYLPLIQVRLDRVVAPEAPASDAEAPVDNAGQA